MVGCRTSVELSDSLPRNYSSSTMTPTPIPTPTRTPQEQLQHEEAFEEAMEKVWENLVNPENLENREFIETIIERVGAKEVHEECKSKLRKNESADAKTPTPIPFSDTTDVFEYLMDNFDSEEAKRARLLNAECMEVIMKNIDWDSFEEELKETIKQAIK